MSNYSFSHKIRCNNNSESNKKENIPFVNFRSSQNISTTKTTQDLNKILLTNVPNKNFKEQNENNDMPNRALHFEPCLDSFPKPCPDPLVINCYINAIEPSVGPNAGNNIITLCGNGFSFVKLIIFGKITITTFNIIDNEHITFRAPPLTSDRILCVAVSGEKFISNQVSYTYVAPPIISLITPNAGPIAGNNVITITGVHLASTQSVQFGITETTNFYMLNDTTINVIVPSFNVDTKSVTDVNISVKTSSGNSNMLIYIYLLPPII
jgi:hypothetical protein